VARPLRRRLAQAPPAGADGVPPSRWTLAAIRAAVPALTGYSRSGVWRVLTRAGFRLRAGRPQQFSPDPAYAEKVTRLEAVLAEAAAAPGRVAALFLDEMGYTRWPEPGPVWSPTAPAPAPVAERAGAPPRLWRLVGALNAVTGRVDTADNYIVGRRQLVDFYEQLAAAYPDADRIYVVQDNWSIHRHPDVLAELERLGRITPVWLPTYAPWLNPIEKLWRLLRQEVLRQHRLAGDWTALQNRVAAFFARFAIGSDALLRYVGLRGDGHLARALRTP